MAETHLATRSARRFTDAKTAISAAEGNCPTHFLIAWGGHTNHASDLLLGPSQLKAALEECDFGTRPFDAVHLWLPDPRA